MSRTRAIWSRECGACRGDFIYETVIASVRGVSGLWLGQQPPLRR